MRNIFIILLAVLTSGVYAKNEAVGKEVFSDTTFVKPVNKKDSLFVADRVDYGFVLRDLKPGIRLMFPDAQSVFRESPYDCSVVRSWQIDTLSNGDISAGLRIALFDEGEIELPMLTAFTDEGGKKDTLCFKPSKINVSRIPVDTSSFRVREIKGQIKYPLTFKEILPYILIFMITIAILTFIYMFVKKLIINKKKKKEVEPAHIRALRALDSYRGEKFWKSDKQKIFYSAVSDILREYIADRYKFGALEMTTDEIMTRLDREDLPGDLYEELKSLLTTADFVKFAKLTVDDKVNASTIPMAVKFVMETYRAEIEKESETKTN